MHAGTCHICKLPVTTDNDKGTFMALYYGEGIFLYTQKAQHVLASDTCKGSPSLAQYVGGPRDERKDGYGELLYPYSPEVAVTAEATWKRMQD